VAELERVAQQDEAIEAGDGRHQRLTSAIGGAQDIAP
jgi:hypothetical protein